MRKKHQRSLPQRPSEYPVGSFLRTPKGAYYIVAPGKRYKIISDRCLVSWSPHRIIETSDIALKDYKITAKLKFRNGSLIHNVADGKIYLIESGKRRHITSPDALAHIGAVMKEVVNVSDIETNLHQEGEPLT